MSEMRFTGPTTHEIVTRLKFLDTKKRLLKLFFLLLPELPDDVIEIVFENRLFIVVDEEVPDEINMCKFRFHEKNNWFILLPDNIQACDFAATVTKKIASAWHREEWPNLSYTDANRLADQSVKDWQLDHPDLCDLFRALDLM